MTAKIFLQESQTTRPYASKKPSYTKIRPFLSALSTKNGQKPLLCHHMQCIFYQTSTPSDGPPLRFKTIILIQITKINLKNINGLKENGQKQSKSLSNVTTCNVFLTKKGQNGQNQIFPGTFNCFFQK